MEQKTKFMLGCFILSMGMSLHAHTLFSSSLKVDTTKTEQKVAKEVHKTSKDTADVKKGNQKKNPYDDLIKKGGTTLKGLFTVHHIEDKWYFEVPDSLLGRYFLAVTRLTAAPQGFGKFAGEMINESTIYFEKRDGKTMLMRAYVLSQLASDKDKISQTLKASTVNPIVASFKIIGTCKEQKNSLIDVTRFFNSDNKVMSFSSRGSQSLQLSGLLSDRTFIDTLKVFPINIEVASTRTYNASGYNQAAAQTGTVTVGLNTSMVLLPKTPMRKRLWDARVGYFTDGVTYFNDQQHKADREGIIGRFRLVPKDVKRYQRGELVEPIKPIVFYIDPATPKKWVPYLIKGVNDWQVAFEAAGFKHAIMAKPWPKNRPDMSVDDARYNVIRYLPAEIENAYGPHVVDPRSGETIESHVCWYHNVMNLLTKWYMTQCGPLDKRAQKMPFDDKLMGELIRFVSSHEVGHTLGLRHNMGASHATPVEKLRNKAWVEKHGHTVSIMDYARFNYVAQPQDGISERGLFPRINDYDKWAIKWGYQYRPEFKDEFQERDALRKETTQILRNNPKLWFSGEGNDEDPRSQTEDLGDDNVKASNYGILNLKRVIANLPKWTKQPDEQYDNLKEMYNSVRGQFGRYIGHVLKNIGGRYLNNLPGTKPFEVAPAYKQKEAIGFLEKQLFDAPLWLYPSNITQITGTNAIATISRDQNRTLATLLSLATLTKIYNDSYDNAKAYQLPDYLNDLFHAVWKPLTTDVTINNTTRRTLERSFLSYVDKVLNPVSTQTASNSSNANRQSSSTPAVSTSDALLYVELLLNKIETYCKTQRSSSASINALHYDDLLRQIKLIKDKRITVKVGSTN